MRGALYLAWRYLLYHRWKTAILVTSITLIVYLPVGLRVLVDQSRRQLTARAEAIPLVIGAKGSPLELALNTLYFGSDVPEEIRYGEVMRVADSGLARAVPMHVRFRARGRPIVGTSLEYFAWRGLRVESGRQMAMLGECVLGSRAAEALGAGPGDALISSPESVFDLAGVYPLKMPVMGVLSYSDSADDDAVFVDVKTAWVIQGLAHGHMDMASQEATAGVLKREEGNVVANASVVQYNEITPQNADSFHFHGDPSGFPLTAVIALPPDHKSSAILQGRYESGKEPVQIVRTVEVMEELLDTILTVEKFVVAGAIVVGAATLALAALVFLLSLRLRRRERQTLHKIGGSRPAVALVMASEVLFVLVAGLLLAGGLTLLTREFGSLAIRFLIRM